MKSLTVHKTFLMSLAAALLAAGSTQAVPEPGLKQYKLSGFGDKSYCTPGTWSNYWDKTAPVVMPGALMAKKANVNGTTWKGVSYPFSPGLGYWYEGYVKLEAGKTYSVKSAFDDGGCVYIDGKMVYQQGTNSGYSGGDPSVTPDPFVCTETGWHLLQIGMWDWGGGRDVYLGTFAVVQWTDVSPTPDSSTYSDQTVWHEYWDADADGNALGAYLYTERPYAECIAVAGSPAQYGAPSPDYGFDTNVTAGASKTFTCPTVCTNDAETVAAACLGYELALTNGTVFAGTAFSTSIVYSAETACSTLTWLWDVRYKATVTSDERGTVTQTAADGWYESGGTAIFTATPADGYRFTGWTGEGVPSAKSAANPLALTVTAPISLTASFVDEPTFYVALGGDDEAEGSRKNPFATITNALAKANAAIDAGAEHSTIMIGEGLHDLQATINLSRAITVTGEGIGKTVIQRDSSVSSLRMIELSSSSALVENLSVTNGYLSSGRAAGAYVTAGTVRRCEFYNCRNQPWNTGWNQGNCVVLNGTNAKAVACVIRGMVIGDGCGEALYIDGGGVAESCLVCDNKCETTGRASAYMVNVGTGTLRGCTVVNNYMGNSVAVYLNSWNSYVRDCLVYGNSGKVKTTGGLGNGFDIAGRTERVYNTLVTDPGFRDFANKDYSLGPGPAVDAAQYGSDTLALTDVDADGKSRLVGAAVDIGALECQQETAECAFVADRTASLEGDTVTFNLYSIGVGATPTYAIDFGDGSETESTTATSVTHVYEKGGSFTVTLSVPGAKTYVKADAISVKAKNLYVKEGGTGTPPYGKDSPAGYIEDALAEANDGATIWLEDGNYTFKSDARIEIKNGVKIVGLSGNPDKVIVSPHTAETHKMFVLDHADAGLYNLTIQGGYSKTQGACDGCNVKITAVGGTVSNCVLRGGHAGNGYGGAAGGILMNAGLVTHCVISNNYAHTHNLGQTSGAASAVVMWGGRLENSLVAGNRSTGDSATTGFGPVEVAGSTAQIVNCTIAGNKSNGDSGICFYNATGTRVTNTIICDNTSTAKSGDYVGICIGYRNGNTGYVGLDATNAFKNCAAPLLINGTCFATDDLKLKEGYVPMAKSVCRGNATKDGITIPSKDLAGNPRLDEETELLDIGCYQYYSTGLDASISANPVAAVGVTPYAITFTAEVEGGTATGYRWFEDGVEIAGETSATLKRTYTTPCTPTISLKVSDAKGEYAAANTIAVTVYPAVVWVDGANENPSSPYVTEATAANFLEDALAVAGDGTEIRVKPGTYRTKAAAAIDVTKSVVIRGLGTTPAEVVFTRKSTSDTAYQRIFTLNADAVRLENLTVSDALLNSQGWKGAGVYISGKGGTVSNCVIASCRNWSDAAGGGGAYLNSSAALITHSVVTNCMSSRSKDGNGHVGGMGILIDSGTVRETLVAECCNTSTPRDKDVGTDGAISLYGGKVINCTIANCRNATCAGIRANGGEVVNTIVSGNATTSSNPTNAVYAGSAAVFDHCLSDGEAAINDDCFVEPADKTFRNPARNNYRIKSTSLGRDAGKTVADAPAVDLKGKPRLHGKAIDIGAYECQSGDGLMLIVR